MNTTWFRQPVLREFMGEGCEVGHPRRPSQRKLKEDADWNMEI